MEPASPQAEHPTEAEPSPWPSAARFDASGLTVAGVAAEDLAALHGTPLLVVDEEDLRRRCRAFARAFPRTLYAVKSLTCRAAIRIALEEGLGLLVASGGELGACLRSGADPTLIAFHGNNKSDRELEAAVEARIGLLVVDNPDELRRLSEIAVGQGVVQDVLIRVIPGVAAGTHTFVETGELDSKFGTPLAGGAALSAVEAALSSPGIRFRGLHAHIGSQILGCEPHLAALGVLIDVAAEIRGRLGAPVEVLDIGGGFGATYTEEAPPEPAAAAATLTERLHEGASRHGLPVPELIVEPGRALVANPALTLYRVGWVKHIPGVRTYVPVDGGMSDNIRPILYGARYTVAMASPPRGAPTRPATVVGKHCESGDVLARDVDLPEDIRRGDLLAFAATGAYGYSMASNYNRVPRPAVVGVRAGESRVWLRRETEEELDRLEAEAG